MSPRPQVDHIRRPQLLAAAAELIAERGVGATRISDIAERAGTSRAAVLYWFGSKQELLGEALAWEDDRFYLEVTEKVSQGRRPSERMAMLIDAASTGGGWRLWVEMWTRALRDEAAAATRERLDRRWRDEIAGIVRDGQRSGEFIAGDAGEIAVTLGALLDGLAAQLTLNDPEVPAERMSRLARGVAEALLGCILPSAVAGAAEDRVEAAVGAA